MTVFYKVGQQTALTKLGLDRVPRIEGEDERLLMSHGVDPSFKNELLQELRQAQAGHELEPRSAYMLRGLGVGGLAGGAGGGVLGALHGIPAGRGMRHGLIGAAAGGALGGLTGILGGSMQHSGDKSEQAHAQKTLEDPKMFKRDLAGFALRRDEEEEEARNAIIELRNAERNRALAEILGHGAQAYAAYAGSRPQQRQEDEEDDDSYRPYNPGNVIDV
jgi:hypothetical protein